MNTPTGITYIHSIKWQVTVRSRTEIKPNLRKYPYRKCHCKPGEGLYCGGHLAMSFLHHRHRFGMHIPWMRISRRARGRYTITWKGSPDPSQGIEVLKSWGLKARQIGLPRVKGIEVFVCIPCLDASGLVSTLRPLLTFPLCPNRLSEKPVETDEGGRPTDGTKKSFLQGQFETTTLPTFGGRATYCMNLYRIGRTPGYHAKMELIFEMSKGEQLPARCLAKAKKAMAMFLLALCQVGGNQPLPIRQGGKRHQEGLLFEVDGRGCEVPAQKAVDAAQRFSDAFWEAWCLRGLTPEDERLLPDRCLLLTVGKPLHRNRSAWFWRQTPSPLESVANNAGSSTGGSASGIIVEEDEFRGLGDDLLDEAGDDGGSGTGRQLAVAIRRVGE